MCYLVVLLIYLIAGKPASPNEDQQLASHWSYDKQELWPELCQNGDRQSPIAVKAALTKRVSIVPLQKVHFNESHMGTLTNTGHSIQIDLEQTNIPYVFDGGLSGEYGLVQIHFHSPAEHTIDNQRFPLEAHFVLYNRKYGNFSNSLQHEDGLAVLGSFFQQSNVANKELQKVVEGIPKIRNKVNEPSKLERPICIDQLLPYLKSFVRYQGSLTTPSCDEVVTWTLFPSPLSISKKQRFRTVISNTARAIQPTNNREVLFNP